MGSPRRSRGRHWPRPFGSNSMLPVGLLRRHDLDVELFELRGIDRARRAEHKVLVALGLWKCDDVADVLRARDSHHQAVDARGDATMRWHAVLEGVEQVPELREDPFAAHSKNLEDALLQSTLVDTDAAACDLQTVDDAVVSASAHRIRLRVDQVHVLRPRRSE